MGASATWVLKVFTTNTTLCARLPRIFISPRSLLLPSFSLFIYGYASFLADTGQQMSPLDSAEDGYEAR